MKHKLLRALCALLLVCVLLVSWSPIQAKANTLAMAGSAILNFFEAGAAAAGMSVFSYVAIGLGLTFGAAKLADAVGKYIEYSGNLGAKVYYYPDGSWSYGVDLGFIDSVRAFLFDYGYLVEAGSLCTTVLAGETYRGKHTPRLPCVAYSYTYASPNTDGKTYKFKKVSYLLSLTANDPYVIEGTKSTAYVSVNGKKHYADLVYSSSDTISASEIPEYVENSPDFYYLGEQSWTISDVWNKYGWTGIGGNGDVTTESVSSLAVPMTDAYPEWYGNSRPYADTDTDEDVIVLPIPYNPTSDPDAVPDVLTQSDVWQGSIAEPIPGIDAGTDTTISVTPWETFKTWISTGWQAIIQAIPTAGTIADAIGNVIKSIFVPDADFISEKWNAIRSRFDFADSISSSGELILDVLNGIDPEPPVIYVDLGDAEGSYYLGGQVAFLDLRWYERYKPTGDAIISAFLWLVFVWRMFIKLPGIIGGLPGDFVMQGVTDLGLADRLPARKKEYENQRQQNRRFFKK